MAVKDKFLTGGCSFTAHVMEDHLSWAWQLGEEYDVINSAQMGSGNQIICDRICYELSKEEVRKSISAVLVMWSSPFRKEFLFTVDDPDWRDIYNELNDPNKNTFTNYIRNDREGLEPRSTHEMSNWLIIGGGYGVWNFGVDRLDQRINSYYENNFSKDQSYVDMCRAMVTVQSLCKSLDIPLINMGWQNMFHDLHISDPKREHATERSLLSRVQATSGWVAWRFWDNADKKKRRKVDLTEEYADHRIDKKYVDCKHWYDLIDWDTWLFYENDSVKMGGMQEFRVWEAGESEKDLHIHPNLKSQEMWKEFVKEELRRRELL
jgi:hypothetical protein